MRKESGFRIRCVEGQKRWLDGHDNGWKYAADGDEAIGRHL